ncbi:cobalamin B12-binding domain-containing protein, partial [Maribacter dokdonensis]
VNFDQTMFFNTYNALLSENSFREIFKETFVPLLNELGLLWQTDTISPAHEHFMSSLIKQKILLNIEKLQHLEPTKTDKVFVAFLPENEIHDIGLLYINYEIILKGYKCIYLGPTIPLENLEDVLKYFDDIYFVSYFTIFPEKDRVNKYLEEFSKLVADYQNPNFWILGRQINFIDDAVKPNYCRTFTSIDSLVSNL